MLKNRKRAADLLAASKTTRSMSNEKARLLPSLQASAEQLAEQFDRIPGERKETLRSLAKVIRDTIRSGQAAYLNFICTHNSRRSHMAQLWAQAAAHFYEVENVLCLSGGTEATAFNPRAVQAMENVGFSITRIKDGSNPVYEVRYAANISPVIAFSKKYDDPFNYAGDFTAVMTCAHADDNCPIVSGASTRIAITYDDPKETDGTPYETDRYAERVTEIGCEMLYVFSVVDNKEFI
jgi:arsenate reductase